MLGYTVLVMVGVMVKSLFIKKFFAFVVMIKIVKDAKEVDYLS